MITELHVIDSNFKEKSKEMFFFIRAVWPKCFQILYFLKKINFIYGLLKSCASIVKNF